MGTSTHYFITQSPFCDFWLFAAISDRKEIKFFVDFTPPS